MLVATGILFSVGVALFLWDFFFLAPRERARIAPAVAGGTPYERNTVGQTARVRTGGMPSRRTTACASRAAGRSTSRPETKSPSSSGAMRDACR